ncbi:helix-turn-helix domain-containing protein [Tumebacillus permanentifrigoris]|uniref:Regulatory LuxR family protein n=1 Tax=Tumebacillus permanentifrigoris TaxID=378543 RepID=A0A316DEF5_9BACL|nr:helix-turn-helix transcriptional regulator [Tumebacillus permanentifrigoris]PWK16414.1 regulatory LuxR family protein [Tumebacillus permanentifrigoris]
MITSLSFISLSIAEEFTLTPRQSEILELILKGYSNGTISSQLGIAYNTAKNTISNLKLRVRMKTRYEILSYAFRLLAGDRAEQSISYISEKFALSPRESEVLLCLMDGDEVEAIGKRLYISDETVNGHISQILQKMIVASRAQVMSTVLQFVQTQVETEKS